MAKNKINARLHGLGKVGDYSSTLPSSPESSDAEDSSKLSEHVLSPQKAKKFFGEQIRSSEVVNLKGNKIIDNIDDGGDSADALRDSLIDVLPSSSQRSPTKSQYACGTNLNARLKLTKDLSSSRNPDLNIMAKKEKPNDNFNRKRSRSRSKDRSHHIHSKLSQHDNQRNRRHVHSRPERHRDRRDYRESRSRSRSPRPSASRYYHRRDRREFGKKETKSDQQKRLAEQQTGVRFPEFYNPSKVDPMEYAVTVQKRKLLWQNKPATEVSNSWKEILSTAGGVEKFRKLVGMKSPVDDLKMASKDDNSDSYDINNQNDVASGSNVARHSDLFCTLDKQYQQARQATHMQRGLGLGFSSQADEILQKVAEINAKNAQNQQK